MLYFVPFVSLRVTGSAFADDATAITAVTRTRTIAGRKRMSGLLRAGSGIRPRAGRILSFRASRPERGRPGLPAPNGRFAVAAEEDAPVLLLRPLGAARAALRRAGERPRDATRVDARLRAVLRRDVDRGVAAVALARI